MAKDSLFVEAPAAELSPRPPIWISPAHLRSPGKSTRWRVAGSSATARLVVPSPHATLLALGASDDQDKGCGCCNLWFAELKVCYSKKRFSILGNLHVRRSFSICVLVCTCVIVDRGSPSTVQFKSLHQARCTPNARMGSCSADLIEDASRSDLDFGQPKYLQTFATTSFHGLLFHWFH